MYVFNGNALLIISTLDRKLISFVTSNILLSRDSNAAELMLKFYKENNEELQKLAVTRYL
jgi:hypothetical protein